MPKKKSTKTNTIKQKKTEKHYSLKKEILGVLLVALSIFIFITLYWSNVTGIIGVWLFYILRFMLGKGAELIAYFLFLMGISLLFGRKIIYPVRWIFSLFLIFLSFIVFWDMIAYQPVQKFLPLDFLSDSGGILGRFFNYLFNLTGIAGAYLIILALLLIGLIISFNFSWRRITENKEQKKEAKEIKKDKKFKAFIDPKSENNKNIEVQPQYQEKTPKRELKFANDDFIETIDLDKEVKFFDGYKLPPLSILDKPQKKLLIDKKAIDNEVKKLETTLKSFNVDARVIEVVQGPAITRYELEPGKGVRINKIANLADDIALSLASSGVRIEAPIPGKSAVGIEIPNKEISLVQMLEIVSSKNFQKNDNNLVCALGKDIGGNAIVFDLAKMPHILIAGATGSGKSVCINTIIASLLLKNRPDEVKLIMIDPKKVELSLYNGIPHLLTPVVTDPKLAAATLKNWAIKEMDRRYEEFSQVGVKNIEAYNEYINKANALENTKKENKIFKKLPYIVVLIDELADLMMVASGDVESSIIRIAQLARATGIHLVVATQRPSVNVITGLIKANIPSRISFAVSSQVDARTIMDNAGAEKLLGRGDMLYSPVGVFKPMRIQGVYLNDQELNRLINYVKKQAKPEYSKELERMENLIKDSLNEASSQYDDPLYIEAKTILQNQTKPSISFLQRKLKIGYNRAARIFEELLENGDISKE